MRSATITRDKAPELLEQLVGRTLESVEARDDWTVLFLSGHCRLYLESPLGRVENDA